MKITKNSKVIWFLDKVYGQQFVIVLASTHAKFRATIKKELNVNIEEGEACEPSGQFCEFSCPEHKMSVAVIWSSDEQRSLLHEIFHACSYVLRSRGIALDSEGSEEGWAYYLTYVWQTIKDKIKMGGLESAK